MLQILDPTLQREALAPQFVEKVRACLSDPRFGELAIEVRNQRLGEPGPRVNGSGSLP